MARFSDINRADELKAAATALDLWRRKTRAEKKTAYEAATAIGGGKRLNRGSKVAFIQPFGAPNNFWYETKILAPATEAPTVKEENATALVSVVVNAVVSFVSASVPVGANNMSNQAKKIQFAKLRCTEKTGAGIATTSRMTGLPYTKQNSNTASSPFGAGPVISSQPSVTRAIKLAIMATPVAGRSFGFTPQGYVGNITSGGTV